MRTSYQSIFHEPYVDEGREQRMLELRRAAQANLAELYRNRDKVKPESISTRKRKPELEEATAAEIQLGYVVLERRAINKILNRLLTKANLTDEEHGAAEEYQSQVDKFDEQLAGYTELERRRFVRLWNKSRKAKYKVLSYEEINAGRKR